MNGALKAAWALIELMRPALQVQGLVLEEHTPTSTCPPVKFTKQGRSLLLRPDNPIHVCDRQDCHAKAGSPNERLFPFFVPQKEGLTALCDYLIFYEPRACKPDAEAGSFVFLCELKSGSVKGSRRQLQNGKLLAEYLLAMARLHGEVHAKPIITYRGIVFSPRTRAPKPGLKGPRFVFEQDDKLSDLGVTQLPADTPWDLDALCCG